MIVLCLLYNMCIIVQFKEYPEIMKYDMIFVG